MNKILRKLLGLGLLTVPFAVVLLGYAYYGGFLQEMLIVFGSVLVILGASLVGVKLIED